MDDTRDMVIRANTKIDTHVDDCIRFRATIAKSFDDVRADLKKQSWYLTLIIGGLIALSRLPEIMGAIHKASN